MHFTGRLFGRVRNGGEKMHRSGALTVQNSNTRFETVRLCLARDAPPGRSLGRCSTAGIEVDAVGTVRITAGRIVGARRKARIPSHQFLPMRQAPSVMDVH